MIDSTEAESRIRRYFDCFKNPDREGLETLLAKSLSYNSPYGSWNDRDQMLDTIWPGVTGATWATDLQLFGEYPTLVVLYRQSGKASNLMAERFHFTDGLISEIEVFIGRET